MTFTPPIAAQRLLLDTIADISTLPGAEDSALVDAILAEAGKLAAGVFAPLNRIGDTVGATWRDGTVTLPEGFGEALAAFGAGGWIGLNAAPQFGGQGLPFTLACAVMEQLAAANLALSLCPMLTLGAIEALTAHGSPELKQQWLNPLVEGRYTGTMNLTEPQAGSDVGALRTEATPAADGSWRLRGSKIFITWGEHDLAENIVHLVLARTPGSPPGTKGISLFLVPKLLADGQRNDVRCVSIEHKLGIHASPTCTLAFGDHNACIGWLIGEENGGMRAMFTMMNNARINVGIQGIAVAERATQAAAAYAAERVQGRGADGQPARIIAFADVRRMLMTMRALTEAARAIALLNAAAIDRAHHGDAGQRGLADLLTPVTKAFGTDVGVEVASLGVQVFGGMGFIEETGAAQYYRDARITPIYEGTNGIQALDLVGRKLPMDGGQHWRGLLEREQAFVATLAGGPLADLAPALHAALAALLQASEHIAAATTADREAAATPYLRMFALSLAALLLARQAVVASHRLAASPADAFLQSRLDIARFFIAQLLPAAPALLPVIQSGASTLFAVPDSLL